MSRVSNRSIQGVSALEWLNGASQQDDGSFTRRRRSLATDAADAEEEEIGNYSGMEDISRSQYEQRLAALESNQALILNILQQSGLIGGEAAAPEGEK